MASNNSLILSDKQVKIERFETFLKVAKTVLRKTHVRIHNKKERNRGYDSLTIHLARLIETEVQDAVNMKNDNFLQSLEEEERWISDLIKIDQDVLLKSVESVLTYFPKEFINSTSSDEKKKPARKLQVNQTIPTFSSLWIETIPSIMLRASDSTTSLSDNTKTNILQIVENFNTKISKNIEIKSSQKVQIKTASSSLSRVNGQKISKVLSSLSQACKNLTF